MDDLAQRIRATLENPNTDPWLPELTDEVTAREWDRLHRRIGITPDNYATARIVSRSVSSSHHITTSLETCSSAAAPAISIEAARENEAGPYNKAGVTFYSSDEILNTTILTCIEEALAVVNEVPSLMRTVASLVRSLHVIRPEDSDCDVSFSEPHVPFSIFLSVPQERIANDTLRVAEAIVHEAMHLQLTLIDKVVPFVGSKKDEYFSPWRGEFRNSEGLLHALYVFRVIDRFFFKLLARPPVPSSSGFMQERRRQIRSQLSCVESFRWSQDLTPLGRCLTRNLLCH